MNTLEQFGTLGNKPIYLVELNDGDIMKSKIAFTKELDVNAAIISLYAATKFMPFEELILNESKN